MAGIEVGGGHGGKRATNHEIPLIPFIDFLLCLVAFLLVTAVWSQMARINADANVPGRRSDEPPPGFKPEKQLHVEMRGERKFQLVWKEGSTVINTIDVERKAIPIGDGGDFAFPLLEAQVEAEWTQHGSHRAPADIKFDRAVLHSDNSTEFAELVAVLDALNSPTREIVVAGAKDVRPVFDVTFAIN